MLPFLRGHARSRSEFFDPGLYSHLGISLVGLIDSDDEGFGDGDRDADECWDFSIRFSLEKVSRFFGIL